MASLLVSPLCQCVRAHLTSCLDRRRARHETTETTFANQRIGHNICQTPCISPQPPILTLAAPSPSPPFFFFGPILLANCLLKFNVNHISKNYINNN